MSSYKGRVQTLRAIVFGSRLNGHSMYNRINGEYNEIANVLKINKKPRRFLLQVLHSTRALDSTLKALIETHGHSPTRPTIGSYLRDLGKMGILLPHEIKYFHEKIVKPRNRYMHEAGAYPRDDNEVKGLLSEMDACLSRVL